MSNQFLKLNVSDFNQQRPVLVNLGLVRVIQTDCKTNGSILTFVDGQSLSVVESIEIFQTQEDSTKKSSKKE